MKVVLLRALGSAAVIMGAAGLVLPLVPATPFFLLAAWCFVRSSPQHYEWLLSHRWFGPLILAYREKRGLSPQHKVGVLAMLWLVLSVSAVLCPIWWVRVFLGLVGVGVTAHILLMRTARRREPVLDGGECAPE